MRLTIAELHESEGRALGATEWRRVGQEKIDLFAEATDDFQWIHVDPARAAASPFQGTVAHGYLTLALLSVMFGELLEVTDSKYVVNYGINRLRFTSAVPSGSEIRLRATISGVEARGDGILVSLAVEVERKDGDRPALVGEVLFLVL